MRAARRAALEEQQALVEAAIHRRREAASRSADAGQRERSEAGEQTPHDAERSSEPQQTVGTSRGAGIDIEPTEAQKAAWNGMIGRSLTKQEATELIERMEATAEVAPEMELTIENWDAEFGKDGIVNTPIGEVKMGENQFTKLMRQGRNGKLGMVKPTLENPDIIIEDSSKAKDGTPTERESSYVFVRAFVNPDGLRYYYFTSVTVSKDGHEVVISNQEKRRNVLTNLLIKGKLVWKHADNVSTASDVADGLYSSQGDMSDPAIEGTVAPQTNNTVETSESIDKTTDTGDNPTDLRGGTALSQNSGVSEGKDNTFSANNQENKGQSEDGGSAGMAGHSPYNMLEENSAEKSAEDIAGTEAGGEAAAAGMAGHGPYNMVEENRPESRPENMDGGDF